MSDSRRAAEAVVGTWRLLSFTEEDLASKKTSHPLGENPNAWVIYAADGHAATIFTTADRTPPAAAQATDEEAVRLYRSMVAFAGRYELDGDKLIYYPEASWNEAWNGVAQVRLFAIEGDRLSVKSEPAVSTLTGAKTVFSLVWRRAT